MFPLQSNSNYILMVIKIKFCSKADGIFCIHEVDSGMAAAISYVESLKKSFVIDFVDVDFPDTIVVLTGGGWE